MNNENCQTELFICGLHEEIEDSEHDITGIARKELGITRDSLYTYNGKDAITICPEPITFLHDYDNLIGKQKEIVNKFRKEIETFQTIELDKVPKFHYDNYTVNMWEGKTTKAINLRPGYKGNTTDEFGVVQLNDDQVHGLIAGRTGSGKSVFVNQLILNMITEYAPWELDLYLADFKKVELSRYMTSLDGNSKSFTPHIKACAATSQMTYIMSLFQNLVDKMNARNEFFTRLGVTKLSDFRKEYNLVLPRVLLIIDEFQQMFAGASSKESQIIQNLLNLITKLGRSTGFHLIFASQEMGNSLSGNTLANFKIRMALPCDAGVSQSTIGNTEASKIDKGYVIINTGTSAEDNKKFHVPYFNGNDDESKKRFYNCLTEVKNVAKEYTESLKYKTTTQKFYNEDQQESEKAYTDNLEKLKDKKAEIIKFRNDIFDSAMLGETTLYSDKKTEIESFVIENTGINRGILIQSSESDDIAKIRKILFYNLETYGSKDIIHYELHKNSTIKATSKLSDLVSDNRYHEIFDDDLPRICGKYYVREFIANSKYSENISNVISKIENIKAQYIKNETALSSKKEYLNKKNSLEDEIKCLQTEKIEKEKFISLHSKENPIISFIRELHGKFYIKDTEGKRYLDISTIKEFNNLIEMINTHNDVFVKDYLKEIASKAKKEENKEQFINLNLLKRCIAFYSKTLDISNVPDYQLSVLKSAYNKVEKDTLKYKKYLEQNNLEDDIETIETYKKEILDIESKIVNKQFEIEELQIPEIMQLEEDVEQSVKSLITLCYQYVYTKLKEKTPELKITVKEKDGNLIIEDNTPENTCDDLILLLNGGDPNQRTIVWINGLDEFEKIPKYLVNFIQYSLKQNILVIVNASTKIEDISIKKVFEYVFVTGNTEKMYLQYDIPYRNPQPGSIMCNLKIVSKNIYKAFKMPRIELENPTEDNFMNSLIEETLGENNG